MKIVLTYRGYFSQLKEMVRQKTITEEASSAIGLALSAHYGRVIPSVVTRQAIKDLARVECIEMRDDSPDHNLRPDHLGLMVYVPDDPKTGRTFLVLVPWYPNGQLVPLDVAGRGDFFRGLCEIAAASS